MCHCRAPGRLVTRTGKYKPLLLAGAAIQLIGLFLMQLLTKDATPFDVTWRLFVVGLGLGPSQSIFSIVAVSAVQPRQVGVATSTRMFLRQIGGLIGVAIFGAMLTAQLQRSLAAFLPPGVNLDLGKMEAMAMTAQASGHAMPIPPAIASAFADAMSYIFTGAMAVVAVGFVSIFFIPHIHLRGRGPEQNQTVQSVETALADAAPAPADPPPMPTRDK